MSSEVQPAALRIAIALAIAGQALVLLGISVWSAAIAIAAFLFAARGAVGAWKVEAAVAALLLPLAALASYPPLAFDETLYHLPFVRAIAESGRITLQPDLRFPIFPQLHEALCAPVFLAFGDTPTHLVSVLELALLVAIVWRWAGPLAALLVAGHPIVLHLATITYVDTALMLFVAAGFFCLDRDEPLAAGFLFGTACSVKYLGWYFVAAALVVALVRRQPKFLAGLLAGILPMYATIVAHTGNPLFPFLGSSAWAGYLEKQFILPWRVLWDITFARERVNQQPPYSPLFAVCLIATFVLARRDRRALFVAALSAGYLAIFAFLPQDSRYLLPLVPLVSVVVAPHLPWKKTLAILSAAIAVASIGYRFTRLGPIPRTAAERERFLDQRIPEYRALRHRGPGPIYVCGAEQLQYFGDGDLVGDVVGPWTPRRVDLTKFRYVLVSRRGCPQWQRLPFDVVYADAGATLWRVSPR